MKKSKFLLTLFIPVIFIFLSCNTEKKEWERVRSINEYWEYYSFLEKYPDGEYSDSVRILIEIAYFTMNSPEQYLTEYPYGIFQDSARNIINDWCSNMIKTVRNIKLEILQSNDYSESFKLPYQDQVKQILSSAGFNVVHEKYDAILKVSVVGSATDHLLKEIKMTTEFTLEGTVALYSLDDKCMEREFRDFTEIARFIGTTAYSDRWRHSKTAVLNDSTELEYFKDAFNNRGRQCSYPGAIHQDLIKNFSTTLLELLKTIFDRRSNETLVDSR